MKITKMDDERINLSLNPKQRNQNKSTKVKIKNMKCAKPRYKQNFIMMVYKHMNTKISNKVIVKDCQRHKKTQEQRLNKRFKSNF